MSMVSFQMFQAVDATTPCDPITLGPWMGAPAVVGQSPQVGAVITGGLAPFEAVLVSGEIPTGTHLLCVEFGDNQFLAINGTYEAAGTFVFTAKVKDSNGCESEEKIITINVNL